MECTPICALQRENCTSNRCTELQQEKICSEMFHNVYQSVKDMNLPWDTLIGLTTDEAVNKTDLREGYWQHTGTSSCIAGRCAGRSAGEHSENCCLYVTKYGKYREPFQLSSNLKHVSYFCKSIYSKQSLL